MKAARMVDPGESIVLLGDAPRFVSRGGEKLAAALSQFRLDVGAKIALDAGASTGGFTDCLLQAGAERVIAVDVGYGQLAAQLRDDPRVECRERTNVRHLKASDVDAPIDVIVGDLSFISIATVLPGLIEVASPNADFVLLVKPQFEAGKQEASRGKGVIRDPDIWKRVIGEVVATCSGLGVGIMDLMASPVRGPDGNREFLIHGRAGAPGTLEDADIEAVVGRTAAEEAARS
jgi:23S rRNA (cytidine1920-2'-O)/16S rRNA (cytidine1409-2'-O)-methyltransferase